MMEGAYPLNGQSIEFIPRTWFDTAHWTISFGKAATGLEKNPGLLKDGEVLIPGLPVLPKGGRYHIRFEDDGGEGHRVIIQDLKPGEVRNIGDVEIIQRIVPR